ncbi:filamentation induced by cAMP protein fic [Candidatus Magnetomorum sp. HK-1]|nr:filamentation induced by cAMP protein fic [Candidatus Magnetomorum sp. HK-1]
MHSYKWKPIEDLPDNWRKIASTDLNSLAAIWIEQAQKLKESESLKRFNDHLRRQWAIETGIIENLYSIDRGITLLLIEKGLEASLIPHGATDKPKELVISLIKNQEEALEGIFDFVSQKRNLSTSYIKELHQVFTQNQNEVAAINGLGRRTNLQLIKGEWKKLPNNPTRPDGKLHEYCPPEHVSSEIDRLIEMHHQHLKSNVPPEIEAAWLHHRFTQIHPFQDGNGRIARALASLVLIRARWFPLVIDRNIRGEYIDALEIADNNDLTQLVDLIVSLQKKAFIKALSISEDILKFKLTLTQVISSAGDRLRARFKENLKDRQLVLNFSKNLENIAYKTFTNLSKTLNDELKPITESYFAIVDRSNGENDYWFKRQIVDIAKLFDYYADTRTYRSWIRIKIREERQTELVVSFHSLGVEFIGVIVVSAFIIYRDVSGDEKVSTDGPYTISKNVFQLAYNESEHDIIKRFDIWLKDVVLFGIDEWRRQL